VLWEAVSKRQYCYSHEISQYLAAPKILFRLRYCSAPLLGRFSAKHPPHAADEELLLSMVAINSYRRLQVVHPCSKLFHSVTHDGNTEVSRFTTWSERGPWSLRETRSTVGKATGMASTQPGKKNIRRITKTFAITAYKPWTQAKKTHGEKFSVKNR